ncbi:MAG: lipopolysaccharide biosynthesis protein [Candidatus Hodarchaeota archaeon]
MGARVQQGRIVILSKTSMEKKEDSLNKRYLYKVTTNMVGLPLSLITNAIIPRGLGPEAYGDFNFLTNFFNKIFTLFDSGTSQAFYTKLSQRLEDYRIISFYAIFLLLVTIGVTAFVAVSFGIDIQNTLWPYQSSVYIWMALLLALLTWFSQFVNKIVDAYALTVRGEIVRLSQKFLMVFCVLLMYYFNYFSLVDFFIFSYITVVFISIGWYMVLQRNGIKVFRFHSFPKKLLKKYYSEFYSYSSPLIFYTIVGILVGILDLWMLQKFAGSIQQGYYGLGFKLANIAFVLAGTMTPLITREFSVAYGKNDLQRIRELFLRYIPKFYSIVGVIGIFLMLQADKLTYIFGGKEYAHASFTIALMSLYPIHQTYGQLSGAVFYATGRTKLYRNIGVSAMIFGLFMTFFLIGPEKYFGLNLKAEGLAIKIITLQFIVVNVQLIFNAKLLKMRFVKLFTHQIVALAIFFLIGNLSKYLIEIFTENVFLSFILSGMLYVSLIIFMVNIFPKIFYADREEINSFKRSIIDKLKSFRK